ncbi:tetratricopeptide repeat protein [Devosia sp.]|uniref:tetratricopeptide repeat protein n=1 Tax=Devosia sp. TaxID=1871048 RepID=UPI0032652C5E
MATETAPDREQVTKALGDVLGWEEMSRSPQLGKFLNYIVMRTLDGDGQGIKAYAIAVDVFGRNPDFDPQTDPIVRVQARRLRALLDSYYDGPGRGSFVRLYLPVGRYTPEFHSGTAAQERRQSAEVVPESRFSGMARSWLALAFLVLAVAALAIVMSTMGPGMMSTLHASEGPQPPSVTVFEFQNLTGDANRKPLVAGLSIELVTDLEQFEDVTVRYAGTGVAAVPADSLQETDYNLTGIARISDGNVQYSAILTDARSSTVVWSKSISMKQGQAFETAGLDAISRDFSLILGSTRGPLHAAGREWVGAAIAPGSARSVYGCLMQFHQFRDTGLMADGALASDCFAGLPDGDRQSGRALAAAAILLIDAPQPRDGDGAARVALARDDMQMALAQSPISGFVWEQQARFAQAQGDVEASRVAFSSSVQLNPANADALAGFARLLALGGNLDDAIEMSNAAVYASPEPPPWYYGVPALVALHESDFALAIEDAAIYATADRELGPVLAVVAAVGSNNTDVVNRYLPQILDATSFRAEGILPSLRRWVADKALLDTIAAALKHAGVPDEALRGSF